VLNTTLHAQARLGAQTPRDQLRAYYKTSLHHEKKSVGLRGVERMAEGKTGIHSRAHGGGGALRCWWVYQGGEAVLLMTRRRYPVLKEGLGVSLAHDWAWLTQHLAERRAVR
jgi:hypothetical protein